MKRVISVACIALISAALPAAENSAGHSHDTSHGHDHEIVKLTTGEMQEFGITTGRALQGEIGDRLNLPGEVVMDPERLTHIVPRVPGITVAVYKSLGDEVNTGDLLAVLSSRELAEIRAETEAAASRHRLAEATFNRESKLIKEGITSETEYLEARQARDATRIEYNLAQQKLEALGLPMTVSKADCDTQCDPTRYEIRSPRDGIIIEKHIVEGELLDESSRPFIIANLDRVWVHMTIYPGQLQQVHTGQQVEVMSGADLDAVTARIDYISPIISRETRTATARIVLANPQLRWRPGQFVTVNVDVARHDADIVVPKMALLKIDDHDVVFVREGEQFIPRQVTTGSSDSNHVEITSGLVIGEEIVIRNAFTLKAELQKGEVATGHVH